MDPLSIVASSSGLLLAIGKTAYLLHNFISSTKEVHSTIITLHADITSLTELLNDLKLLFGREEIEDAVREGMDNFNGRVWRRAGGILESVRRTVEAVEELIGRVEGRGKGGRKKGRERGKEKEVEVKKAGLMRRIGMQFKMEFLNGEFELRHRQLQTQRSTLQIFLASITVCLQIHSENEQATATENILGSLEALKQDVKRLDSSQVREKLQEATSTAATHQGPGDIDDSRKQERIPSTSGSNPFDDDSGVEDLLQHDPSAMESVEDETDLLVENLEDTLESAKEVIHSVQASIASRREGSVHSDASVAFSDRGSMFNFASRHRVGNWVSENAIEEESSSDSDTDSVDLDFAISKRFQVQGNQHFEKDEFTEAEDSFRLSLRHLSSSNEDSDKLQNELKLSIALSRSRRHDWTGVEDLIKPLTRSHIETTDDSKVLTAWHLLAEYKLRLEKFKEAEDICRRVTKRRKAVLRKRDPAQEESMALLIGISQAISQRLRLKGPELLEHGIDVESSSYNTNEELRKAAFDGNESLLRLLLSLPDADIDSTCKHGLNAVDYASVIDGIPTLSILSDIGGEAKLANDIVFANWKVFHLLPKFYVAMKMHSLKELLLPLRAINIPGRLLDSLPPAAFKDFKLSLLHTKDLLLHLYDVGRTIGETLDGTGSHWFENILIDPFRKVIGSPDCLDLEERPQHYAVTEFEGILDVTEVILGGVNLFIDVLEAFMTVDTRVDEDIKERFAKLEGFLDILELQFTGLLACLNGIVAQAEFTIKLLDSCESYDTAILDEYCRMGKEKNKPGVRWTLDASDPTSSLQQIQTKMSKQIGLEALKAFATVDRKVEPLGKVLAELANRVDVAKAEQYVDDICRMCEKFKNPRATLIPQGVEDL